MKPLSCAFLLFALLVSAAPGLCSPRRRHHHPAQASAAATQPATPTLKVDPLELLRQFEAPANEQYRLGPGDVVTISIPGHPEIPAQQTIGPDGRITLPLAGDIELNNKTRPQ
ncbi:MAG: polysaccharide biosynthesis/export family protein, partial [Acidobacteriota bacterium]